jgi:hypothetical protein
MNPVRRADRGPCALPAIVWLYCRRIIRDTWTTTQADSTVRQDSAHVVEIEQMETGGKHLLLSLPLDYSF